MSAQGGEGRVSWGWFAVYATALAFNAGIVADLICELLRTGNISVGPTPPHTLPTLEAISFLVGFGCSVAAAAHALRTTYGRNG